MKYIISTILYGTLIYFAVMDNPYCKNLLNTWVGFVTLMYGFMALCMFILHLLDTPNDRKYVDDQLVILRKTYADKWFKIHRSFCIGCTVLFFAMGWWILGIFASISIIITLFFEEIAKNENSI